MRRAGAISRLPASLCATAETKTRKDVPAAPLLAIFVDAKNARVARTLLSANDEPATVHVGTAAQACPERSRRGCPAERSSAAPVPDAADIEIDASFVGNTPSTVGVAAGQHQLSVKKSGFKPWEGKIIVSSGQVSVNAVLEPQSK